MTRRSAAIVTVGSELTEGMRLDTNSQEIALALSGAGFTVEEIVSVGDDAALLAEILRRLTVRHELVITTGGLGPTHDDITRAAASDALELELVRDDEIAVWLETAAARHADPEAAAQVLVQALVLEGAEVIPATTGTAPGQIVPTSAGGLALLPGPPTEMRPMLAATLQRVGGERARPRELGIVGMTESDVQVCVQRSIAEAAGVGFTVLARPGDVKAIFVDQGGGAEAVDAAALAAARALGDACYSTDGASLPEVVLREAVARELAIAAAESCTGGMVSAALTDVAGSSAAFLGAVVSYSNEAKDALLGVPEETLRLHGAVSAETVDAMARGALQAFGADLAVSISGIAGPDGGTPDKPVGTVWFALAARGIELHGAGEPAGGLQILRHIPGDRAAVRLRATSFALDLVRRAVLGLPIRS